MITFFGLNNQTSASAVLLTFTPPTPMQAGDYVLVMCAKRVTGQTWTVSNAGGQTWTSEAQQTQGATQVSRLFHCRFNGTWSANPVFTTTSTSGVVGGVMLVFRGVSLGTAIDVAYVGAAYAAPGGSFDVTIAAITTTTVEAMAVAFWTSVDDNTWALQTGGWTNPSAVTQWVDSTTQSRSAAYQMFAAIGSTGTVTNRQATLGGDAGITHILALRSTPPEEIMLAVNSPWPDRTRTFPEVVASGMTPPSRQA